MAPRPRWRRRGCPQRASDRCEPGRLSVGARSRRPGDGPSGEPDGPAAAMRCALPARPGDSCRSPSAPCAPVAIGTNATGPTATRSVPTRSVPGVVPGVQTLVPTPHSIAWHSRRSLLNQITRPSGGHSGRDAEHPAAKVLRVREQSWRDGCKKARCGGIEGKTAESRRHGRRPPGSFDARMSLATGCSAVTSRSGTIGHEAMRCRARQAPGTPDHLTPFQTSLSARRPPSSLTRPRESPSSWPAQARSGRATGSATRGRSRFAGGRPGYGPRCDDAGCRAATGSPCRTRPSRPT